jgi:hypothetical protein
MTPYLTSLDFFLQSYGSTGHVDNMVELKYWITAAVTIVTRKLLSHMWDKIKYRLDICCVNKEAHVEIY